MKRFLLIPLLILSFSPVLVHAQYSDVLDDATSEVYTEADGEIGTIISTIINTLLSILGIILLLYIIYAGFLWMTAGGNSEQVGKAKTIMMNTIVGLIITLSAYGISAFVIKALVTD